MKEKEKKERTKIKDSKLFKFMTEKFPDIAGKGFELFGDLTGKESIESLGKWMQGEKDMSPIQIIEFNKAKELDLADMADARNMNVKIQESKEASWLAKNSAYILDYIIAFSFVGLLFYVIKNDIPEGATRDMAMIGMGVLGNQLAQVIHFHRGSTQGSKDKTQMLGK